MKKTYMAPVMESEEFLANEYCKPCCKIVCIDKNHEHSDINDFFIVDFKPTYDIGGDSDDGFVYGNLPPHLTGGLPPVLEDPDGRRGANYYTKDDKFKHSGNNFQDYPWAKHIVEEQPIPESGIDYNGKHYGPNAS